MVAMAGVPMPDIFFCIAGTFLTSCGWIDALLYTLTRRVLVSSDLSSANYTHNVTAITTNVTRPGDMNDFGLQSMSSKEPIAGTARTVTITGGNRISRIVEHRRGRSHTNTARDETQREDSPIRTGSTDNLKPVRMGRAIEIVTETNIRVESPFHGEGERDASLEKQRENSEHSRR
jgi:hypothetical protein